MTRLLILIVLGVLLWLGVERAFDGLRAALKPPGRTGPTRPPTAITETLVRCARCGVHVPRSRSLPGDGNSGGRFCSSTCRDAARGEGR